MAKTENLTGADCSGSSGQKNRVLTLSNNSTTSSDNFYIFYNGLNLTVDTQYSVSHSTSGTTVTFLIPVWDDNLIIADYVLTGESADTGTATALLDNQIFINTISELGEVVTVRTVTDDDYSKWGDATESTSDEESVKAMVDDITPEEVKETEGILTLQDKIFYFNPNQSNISNGNRIVHNSTTYEIVRVQTKELGSIDFVIEAWGKRV